MSTATISAANLKETLLRKVNVLPADYYPKVLRFIETLERDEEDVDDWNKEDWDAWLRQNPPIPIEEDPTITPEHLERLRQRFRDVEEGRAKVVTFSDEEWSEFCEEIERSPEEAFAKARSRAHYRTPKQ